MADIELVIRIPEDTYTHLCNGGNIGASLLIENAIKNGTPIPDHATNGNVIKAMFPNLEIEHTDTDEYTNKPKYVKLIVGNTIITRMSADRWNAPYQKGGK